MRLFAISFAAFALSVAAQAQPKDIKDGPLVACTVVDYAIDQSLTGKPGDAQKGHALSITSGSGNRVMCHKLPIPEVALHIGNVGPDLTEVADRMTEGEIRLQVVNPKLVSDETIMPAYYRIGGLNRLRPNAQGKPMLTPEQVEDLVAYLMTMKPK